MIETTIIIPTHDNWACVKRCIDSVLAHSNNYELIFVADPFLSFRGKLVEYGKVLAVSDPFNFAQRINRGIFQAKGEFFCILNDDTVVHPGWLEKMITTYKTMGPGIVSARTRVGGCSNKDAQGEGPEIYTLHTINMFATLFSRRVFRVLGSLDERFVYYGGEDDDYSFRALRNKFKLMISDAFVWHKVNESFKWETVKDLLPKTHEIFRKKWNTEFDHTYDSKTWTPNRTMPLVSIIMSTRGHESYIYQAIKSVQAQVYDVWELLIGVDGEDQDDTAQIIQPFLSDSRIKMFKFSQSGSCAVRNQLVSQSAGEFIAIMDSDDIMLPNRLASELNCMREDIDIVYSAYVEEKITGEENLCSMNPLNIPQMLKMKCFFAGGTAMFRRFVLKEKSFNSDFENAFDFEFILRCFEEYKFKHLKEPTLIYRRHSGMHLSGNEQALKQHHELIKIYGE